jgi:hypothetical protein
MPMNRSDEWNAQVDKIYQRWLLDVETAIKGRDIYLPYHEARAAFWDGYSVAEYVIRLEDRKAA